MKPSPVLYAQTMPGVENIAWLEIRERLRGASLVELLFVKDKSGIVVFEFDGDPAELLGLRTTEDVFALVATATKLSRDWRDLRLVAQLIENSRALGLAVRLWRKVRPERGEREALTYRVISRKVGKHQYRRVDFEEAVAKGIQRRYGRRWTLVDDQADVEIWANMLGSRLLCGLRLSDRSMRHRGYQAVSLPAALRPSVAAAMVFLTDPAPGDVFLEPMCGSGTILAERVLSRGYGQVVGGDVSLSRARASVENLGHTSQQGLVCNWDACRLPIATASVDRVAVNLPFGKQLGSRQQVAKLYPPFFAELDRVLKPGGQAVVLSSEYELVKEALRRRKRLANVIGYSIAVLGQWARIYIVRKAKETGRKTSDAYGE